MAKLTPKNEILHLADIIKNGFAMSNSDDVGKTSKEFKALVLTITESMEKVQENIITFYLFRISILLLNNINFISFLILFKTVSFSFFSKYLLNFFIISGN